LCSEGVSTHEKATVISLLIALVAIAIAGNARTIVADVPAPPAIGATIIDFTLPGIDGTDHSLNSLKGKQKFRFLLQSGGQYWTTSH